MGTTTVDSDFIRRAVTVADLNAVRVALYQQTGDPELAELPTAANLDEAQRELLISKAVTWLESNAGPAQLAEPPEAELRALMNMATAEEMGDLEFEARRDLPAFKEFPWTADWTNGKPELPEGFKVAIIGSGGISLLGNSNLVVLSPHFDDGAGAATFAALNLGARS